MEGHVRRFTQVKRAQHKWFLVAVVILEGGLSPGLPGTVVVALFFMGIKSGCRCAVNTRREIWISCCDNQHTIGIIIFAGKS